MMNSPRILFGLIAALIIVLLISAIGKPGPDSDMIVRTVYMMIALGLIGSWVWVEMAGNMTKTLRHLLIWGVIIVVVMLAYDYKDALGFAS